MATQGYLQSRPPEDNASQVVLLYVGDDFRSIHGEWTSFIASGVELEVYLGVDIFVFKTIILYLWQLDATFKKRTT